MFRNLLTTNIIDASLEVGSVINLKKNSLKLGAEMTEIFNTQMFSDTSVWCQGLECVEFYLHTHYMPLWYDV